MTPTQTQLESSIKPKPGFDYIGVSYRVFVLNSKGEVLLRKTSPHYKMEPGTWTRPGGKPEFREPMADAVKREVKEETNLNVELDEVVRVSDMIRPNQHWVSVDCTAKLLGGTLSIANEKNYFEEARWFALDALPAALNSRTKESIEFYMSRK